MKNLKVTINESSGFCFGVVNAIENAEKELTKTGRVYCVGQIVHNDAEMKRLSEKGLVTIDHNELLNIQSSSVLFRAHGEPPESYTIAGRNKNKIIDASCPIILKLQKKIKEAWLKKENIVIFGKKNHPEVIALNAQTNNESLIIEDSDEISNVEFPNEISIYSQTTMEPESYYNLVKNIEKLEVNVKFNDTICKQVSTRKDKMKEFARHYDKIVFVAGKNSSNGKVLYNVCKNANENTFFISSSSELVKDWFEDNDNIGICGATSTPKWQMEKVKEILEEW